MTRTSHSILYEKDHAWQRRIAMAEDYTDGVLSTKEIIEKYECSVGALFEVLDTFNIPRRRVKRGKNFSKKLVDRYLKGDLVTDICNEEGVQNSSFYRTLKRYGIERSRPYGRRRPKS